MGTVLEEVKMNIRELIAEEKLFLQDILKGIGSMESQYEADTKGLKIIRRLRELDLIEEELTGYKASGKPRREIKKEINNLTESIKNDKVVRPPQV